MTSSRLFKYIIQWIVLVGLQVLLFQDFVIFNFAYCFAYAGAFLLLPFEVSSILVMLIAFGTGLAVDVFYDTLGVHAAASVFAAFLRSSFTRALTPQGGYEAYHEPTAQAMGVPWMFYFYLPLCAIHHFTLFMIEYTDLTMVVIALLKALASCVLTWIVTVLIQNVLVPRG